MYIPSLPTASRTVAMTKPDQKIGSNPQLNPYISSTFSLPTLSPVYATSPAGSAIVSAPILYHQYSLLSANQPLPSLTPLPILSYPIPYHYPHFPLQAHTANKQVRMPGPYNTSRNMGPAPYRLEESRGTAMYKGYVERNTQQHNHPGSKFQPNTASTPARIPVSKEEHVYTSDNASDYSTRTSHLNGLAAPYAVHNTYAKHRPRSDSSGYPYQVFDRTGYMDCLDIENGIHLVPHPFTPEYERELDKVQQRAAQYHREKARLVEDLTLQLHYASLGLVQQKNEIEVMRNRMDTIEELQMAQIGRDRVRDDLVDQHSTRIKKIERARQIRVYNFNNTIRDASFIPAKDIARQLLTAIGVGDIQSYHYTARRPRQPIDKDFITHTDYKPLVLLEFSNENLARYVLHRYEQRKGGMGFSMEMDPTDRVWEYPETEKDERGFKSPLFDEREFDKEFDELIRAISDFKSRAAISNATDNTPCSTAMESMEYTTGMPRPNCPSSAEDKEQEPRATKAQARSPVTTATSRLCGLNISAIPEFVPRPPKTLSSANGCVPQPVKNGSTFRASATKFVPTQKDFDTLFKGSQPVVVPKAPLSVRKNCSGALANVAARYDSRNVVQNVGGFISPVYIDSPDSVGALNYAEKQPDTRNGGAHLANGSHTPASDPSISNLKQLSRRESVGLLKERTRLRSAAASQMNRSFSYQTPSSSSGRSLTNTSPNSSIKSFSISDSDYSQAYSPASITSISDSCDGSMLHVKDAFAGGASGVDDTSLRSGSVPEVGWQIVKNKRRHY